MFGPNSTPSFHHREQHFHYLYQRIESKILELAGLPSSDWDLFLVSGSGTAGIEAVIASSTRPVEPLFIEPKTEFAKRLCGMLLDHDRYGINCPDVAYVQYETSLSQRNLTNGKARGITVVDAVSAFPYYDVPPDADVVITVSGKQLGAEPGVALVLVHKRAWDDGFFRMGPSSMSYLDMDRYRVAKQRWETPNTPALGALQSLYNSLYSFDLEALRKTVDERFNRLAPFAPPQAPPVFSFQSKVAPHDRLNLYGKEFTQLFLWDMSVGSRERFDYLLSCLREEKSYG